MKNRYEIEGDVARIWLGGKYGSGKVALINAEDLEKVEVINGYWRCNKVGYVVGTYEGVAIGIHRLVMDAYKKPSKGVHHICGDKLDNRKEYLETSRRIDWFIF